VNRLRYSSVFVTDLLIKIADSQVGLDQSVVVCNMGEIGVTTMEPPVVSPIRGLTFACFFVGGRNFDAETVLIRVAITGAEDSLSNDLAFG